MNKKILIILAIILLGSILVLINRPQTKNSNNKVQVEASFYPLYFFASQIGGDKASVSNITPAGAEPHDYEPTTQEMAKIEKSQILILNGGVEAWGNKIKDNLKDKNVVIIIAGEGLLTDKIEEEGEVIQDPHVWLAPQLAKKQVEKIKEGFIQADSANTTLYETNAKSLEDKLDQLDEKYKKGLSSCIEKDIITSHAAFGYLAKAYGLNQVSVTGVSPDEEPSAQQLAQVAKFAKDNNVKYIFFETLVSPKLSQTIANEVGAETLVLDPIEGISDDDIKQGKNYFTVMEKNLTNLQKALQCNQ